MSKTSDPATPEGRAISAAVARLQADRGLTKKEVAAVLESDPTELYQWETGRRPVPVDRAAHVAERLNTKPEQISARYRDWLKNGGQIPQSTEEGADMSKEVETLRFVVGVLVSTMRVHRPIEAAAAAQALRKQHRGKYLRDEFVREIVAMLDDQPDSGVNAAASLR